MFFMWFFWTKITGFGKAVSEINNLGEPHSNQNSLSNPAATYPKKTAFFQFLGGVLA